MKEQNSEHFPHKILKHFNYSKIQASKNDKIFYSKQKHKKKVSDKIIREETTWKMKDVFWGFPLFLLRLWGSTCFNQFYRLFNLFNFLIFF